MLAIKIYKYILAKHHRTKVHGQETPADFKTKRRLKLKKKFKNIKDKHLKAAPDPSLANKARPAQASQYPLYSIFSSLTPVT